jgi:hypothetical protein
MTTLEELAELLAASTPAPWKVNQYWLDIPWLNRADAALIVGAINALPGLLESAKRVERLEAELSGSARGSLVWWIERAKMQAQDMDDEGILVDRDHWQQIVFLAHTQIARAALKGT